MYSKVSKKDKGLIKEGLRRAMSRSDLRKAIIADCIVEHQDPKRPRVKTWCQCPTCGKIDAKSYFDLDHIHTVVPLDKTLDDMTPDEIASKIWCEPSNLQIMCNSCHDIKTAAEKKIRANFKKRRKNEEKAAA